MPEFELAGADYESAGKPANVVNVERPTGEKPKAYGNPADRESDRENDLIESETQDRREAPGGKPERVSRVSTKEASVP
ncbi:hypothetical protein AB0G32_35670, partial [Streptomyces sp. NPDC023723]|uniref:hypothetical protein n=1 Tax=Streptomyces sp. NPDC023723 TaxID=3154323 RepID=UPI0033C21CF0